VTSIELHGVGKRYWQMTERPMLVQSLLPFKRPERRELWALRDLDLVVDPGEVVGVIGRNGAGKTTLLRLLAGVTRPTEGTVRVAGRIAPLISVGVGFHQEMTGRENVYVNGMLLGLSKPEIDRRFDEIVAFSELEAFVDTPVKFYSSGMFMRLGFAVAIHTEPEVLLVDEVLAVGDLAFQLKCLEKMKEVRQAGATIVLVSHSMTAIRLCPRAVVISRGRLEFDGPAEAAIERHTELLWGDRDEAAGRSVGDWAWTGGAQIVGRTLLADGRPVSAVQPMTPLTYRVRVRFDAAVNDPVFAFRLLAPDGTIASAMHSPLEAAHRSYGTGEEAEVELRFVCRLLGGDYRLTLAVTSSGGHDVLAADPGGTIFHVTSQPWTEGVVDLSAVVVVDGRSLVEERSFNLAPD
jgi:ABC-type polysaccharide/polyol phosphate transport system ATPase subunit